ncbi:MAG: hypothetical protein WC705_00260 [Candidatus Paceibacterota bacterium]|jgi:hypothetical protein
MNNLGDFFNKFFYPVIEFLKKEDIWNYLVSAYNFISHWLIISFNWLNANVVLRDVFKLIIKLIKFIIELFIILFNVLIDVFSWLGGLFK